MSVTQESQIFANRLKRNRSKSRSLALQTLFEIESHLEDISQKLLIEIKNEDRQNIFEILEKLSWAIEKINIK